MIRLIDLIRFVLKTAIDVFFIYVVIFWAGYIYGLTPIPEFNLVIPLDIAAVITAGIAVVLVLISGILKLIRFFILRSREHAAAVQESDGGQSPADSL